jgi:hypothetical protein
MSYLRIGDVVMNVTFIKIIFGDAGCQIMGIIYITPQIPRNPPKTLPDLSEYSPTTAEYPPTTAAESSN